MASTSPAFAQQNGLRLLPGIVRLAGWRFQRMWRFLLITWLGMLAMIVLVCAGPLLAHVAVSAYLRSLVTGAPDGPYITVETVSNHPAQAQVQQIRQLTGQSLQQGAFAPYLHSSPQLIIQTPPFDLLSGSQTRPAAFRLDGYALTQAAQHTNIVQGRLPQVTTDGIVEIALSQDTATGLGLHIGETIQGRYPIALGAQVWTFRVVGIIAASTTNDSFWAMGNPFSKSSIDLTTRYYTVIQGSPSYNVLVVNEALLPKIAALQSTGASPQQSFSNAFVLFWRYPFDLTRLDSNAIPALSQQAGQLDSQLPSSLQSSVPDVTYVNLFGTLFTDLFASSGQVVAVQTELIVLLLVTLALVLFLVSMMSGVLVERQAAIIATLRSRGAKRLHIFGAFFAQGVVLGITALLLGPFLAILLVRAIAQLLLTPASLQSLAVITAHPLQSALDVKWYALIAVAIALFIMLVAVNRAAQLDIVSLRRESSRGRRAPLWRRLNLDLFFSLLLLVGYIAFLYFWPSLTIAGGEIDPTVYVTLTDLGVFAAPLLVAAVLLLFLRLFPLILALATRLLSKMRSAPAVLALAQMQRAPRPAARMIVLLALAIASSFFLVTLIATKDQRNTDVANYYVQAADFSGFLPSSNSNTTLNQLQAYYAGQPGVQAASVGLRDVIQSDNDPTINGQGSLTIDAINPTTYAQTVNWSSMYSSQPLPALTTLLAAQRTVGIAHNTVYALVDAATWQKLHLTQGQQFNLPVDSSGSPHLHFIALARINYIPGVYDTANLPFTGMALIVDYQNYTTVKAHAMGANAPALSPNYLWLRTNSDAVSLAHLRSILPNLTDRRAILSTMQVDPDHLGIIGVLDIGVGAALLLALLGMLIASWHDASSRLTSFAVARALGMTPRQVAALLLWQQGFIYILASLLGAALCAMLTIFIGPTISALTIQHGHAWDVPLNVPPIQTVIPYPQLFLLLGGLILICIVALVLMARIVSRPSLGQTLRLNED